MLVVLQFYFCPVFCVLFEIGCHGVAQVSTDLFSLLPQLPED